MELTVDIQFEQVLKLVRQLPKAELQRLVSALQSQLSDSPESKPQTDWQKLIQQAPTWAKLKFMLWKKPGNILTG